MRFEPIKQVERRSPALLGEEDAYALSDVARKVNELVDLVNALAEQIASICETNNLWDGS